MVTHHENIQEILEDKGFLDVDGHPLQRIFAAFALVLLLRRAIRSGETRRAGIDARVEGCTNERGFLHERRLRFARVLIWIPFVMT
jgi:hypothetical protein